MVWIVKFSTSEAKNSGIYKFKLLLFIKGDSEAKNPGIYKFKLLLFIKDLVLDFYFLNIDFLRKEK